MLKTVTLAPKALMVFRPPGGISEVFATSSHCFTRFNPAIMFHYSDCCFFFETMKFPASWAPTAIAYVYGERFFRMSSSSPYTHWKRDADNDDAMGTPG